MSEMSAKERVANPEPETALVVEMRLNSRKFDQFKGCERGLTSIEKVWVLERWAKEIRQHERRRENIAALAAERMSSTELVRLKDMLWREHKDNEVDFFRMVLDAAERGSDE